MKRRKIELEPDAILPMTRTLWAAALEKVAEAEQGIFVMQNAKNRIEFEAGWIRFVDSLEEFWTRFFDEGKTKFPDFQPWAGVVEAFRKRDELLRYVYEARHQSQHGQIPLSWEEGRIQIKPSGNPIRSFAIFPDGTFEMDTGTNPTLPDSTLIHLPGKPQLPVVFNRKSKLSFAPPSNHAGASMEDISPLGAARIALEYYRTVFVAAKNKFGGR